MLAGGLLFLLVVANDSLMELLLCLVVPLYSLYYFVKNWEETKLTLYLQVYGLVMVCGLMCLMPFHALIYGFGNNRFAKGPGNDAAAFNQAKEAPGNQEEERIAKITGDPELDRHLADLADKDSFKCVAGANALARTVPNQHREIVVERLVRRSRDENVFVRRAAIGALGVWTSDDDLPLLIELLDHPDSTARNSVLAFLGRFKDERAAQAAAKCWKDRVTRGAAGAALREMGPAAEKQVLLLLNENDQGLKGNDKGFKTEVIRLLKDIGTQQSIPALQEVAAGKNVLLGRQARDAVAAIQARLKK